MSGLPSLYTVQDIARMLGSSENSIYRARYAGLGPRGVKVGKRLFFTRQDVDAWLESLREQPQGVSKPTTLNTMKGGLRRGR